MQKDIRYGSYKIAKADNGDAWVEVKGQKHGPPQISAEVLKKMKKTAEDDLASRSPRRRLPFRPTSTTASARPPGTWPHRRSGRQAHRSTSRPPRPWPTAWTRPRATTP